MQQKKEIVQEAMDAFFKDFNEEKMRQLFTEDYIQHNPGVATGLQPVIAVLPKLKDENFGYTIHRCFEDGDLVITHSTFHNADLIGAKEIVAFDVWRIEDGKIAEHWDNIQPKVEKTASGRSMVDGATELEDLDKTEENKTLMKHFLDDVMLGKAPEKITAYINTEQYHQHNPLIPDGFEGFIEAIKYYKPSELNLKVHKILGEGNFVLLLSEGILDGKSTAFYDLFRIKDGKFVEHWDVIQEIPEEMAHNNGKF